MSVLIELNAVLNAIDNEPEYPGEAPPVLCAVLIKAIEDKDLDLLLHAMRQTVRLTKECIALSVNSIANTVMPVLVVNNATFPETIKPVLAVIQHWHTQTKKHVLLKRVDDDDCDWRFAEGNAELSHDWNVVSWSNLPSLE